MKDNQVSEASFWEHDGSWWWRDAECAEDMGPFPSLHEAHRDHYACRPEAVSADAQKVIRELVTSLRWDDQGGYPGYSGDGEWSFSSTSVWVSPEQLRVLCAFTDIVPEPIEILGDCDQCLFAVGGRERGYAAPCSPCSRPQHSNFVERTPRRLEILQQVEANGPNPDAVYNLVEEFGKGKVSRGGF